MDSIYYHIMISKSREREIQQQVEQRARMAEASVMTGQNFYNSFLGMLGLNRQEVR